MAASREDLDREKAALIAEIREAFAGVSREGGVSWSESERLDAGKQDDAEDRAAARALDTDTSWTEVVDDQNWRADMGVGGFNFLDPIGWRYYLPAAMIRKLNGGETWLEHNLDLSNNDGTLDEWKLEKLSLLDRHQRLCVKRFLRFMVSVEGDPDDVFAPGDWGAALASYWASVE